MKRVKVVEKRVCRFRVKFNSDVEVTVGADPFYEQVLLARRKGKEFDHRALFDSCKSNGIPLNPLDGLGNATRTILRPPRKRRTQEDRKVLFDGQQGKCATCGFAFETCKEGHADHITPLGNGGKDELDNMQLLCEPCHHIKTETENAVGYSSYLTHSSRFNPYVLEDIVLSPLF